MFRSVDQPKFAQIYLNQNRLSPQYNLTSFPVSSKTRFLYRLCSKQCLRGFTTIELNPHPSFLTSAIERSIYYPSVWATGSAFFLFVSCKLFVLASPPRLTGCPSYIQSLYFRFRFHLVLFTRLYCGYRRVGRHFLKPMRGITSAPGGEEMFVLTDGQSASQPASRPAFPGPFDRFHPLCAIV